MESSKNIKKKRTQRDYTMAFKLMVVNQVEKGEMTYKEAQRHYGVQGKSTVLVWLRKHGILDWKNQNFNPVSKKETPQQKIKRLEKQLEDEKTKNKILNKMVDILDEDYNIDLRKKYSSDQSKSLDNKKKSQ